MSDLTHERLKELLHYDPETGVFTWRVNTGRMRVGDRAGWEDRRKPNNPYRYIIVDQKRYLSSRLACLWMTGHWPEGEIDHRNCSSLDDRWSNLRLATHGQNMANQRKRSNNKTGFKGVHMHGKRFRAQFSFNGFQRHLGLFDTAEEASAAYQKAAKSVHGEFSHHG